MIAVKEQIAANNTLDLWLANKPSLVKQCNSIPGISDHDIVLTDSDFKAKINKKAALHWTVSMEFRSLAKQGSHTDAAYSRIGLTSDR